LVDEATTALAIQVDEQMITARASGQVALDLQALPRGATICAMLHDASPTIRRSSPGIYLASIDMLLKRLHPR
jgi:hypothetical protein